MVAASRWLGSGDLMNADTKCRLCGAETKVHFTDVVLRKYACQYLLCDSCGSLQTERPYWLEEAYSSGSIADSDTGVFLRGMDNLCVLYISAWLLGMPKRAQVLDFGGGNGLLCRMLRDVGFDARLSDQYARNEIARGFDDLGATPDILCSFEVAEHFPDPSVGMAAILGRGANVCLIGTETYRGQDKNWWYISPQSGQHVFFYSPAGMQILADRHGYVYERVGSKHFFLKRPLRRSQSALLWRALSPQVLRWVRAYLMLRLSNRFANADNATALLAGR
jgi:hypothetical protein